MKKLLISTALSSLLLLPFLVFAGNTAGDNTAGNPSSQTVSLTNPLCPTGGANCVTPQSLIGRVINGVLGVVGSLALLMFVYGGFTWMLSGGNSTAIERGKNILIWAAIGLVVIFMSYALVNFVIEKATSG